MDSLSLVDAEDSGSRTWGSIDSEAHELNLQKDLYRNRIYDIERNRVEID